MYRILVVDDEKTERECIHYLLEDLPLPFEIMEADDGNTALGILETWPADILFTDVQMPIMDGLELIRQAMLLLPELKVIIFSSYADFEYAKTAIRLGVENYILKPVVPDELSDTIHKLTRELHDEREIKIQLERQQSFLLQYVLQLAISGKFDTELADEFVETQLSMFQHMVLIDFPDSFLENNYSRFYDALQLELMLDMEPLNPSPDQALLFLRKPIDAPKEWGNKLLRYIKHEFNTDCYLAIGRPLSDYASYKDAFSSVEQLMERKFWAPEEHVLTMSQQNSSSREISEIDDNQQIQLIRGALAAKNGESLQNSLNLLFEKYRLPSNQSQIYIKFIFSNLLTTLYPYLPATAGRDTTRLDKIISKLYLLQDIEEIISTVQAVADQILVTFGTVSNSVRREVRAVEVYIRQHYSENLSVEQLASTVYLTPDYLSRLFKKSTGISLSQYIRQYRMEKARELLLQTNKKVIQIGAEVGYPNYSYFCQSFREYFGKSPEKYRQENVT